MINKTAAISLLLFGAGGIFLIIKLAMKGSTQLKGGKKK